MKITAQEEYGLRILVRIARCRDEEGISIPHLSESEGLSSHYVAKLTRLLRLHEFIKSTPGNKGGYVLARAPKMIRINNVLESLGGKLFDKTFCGLHTGNLEQCINSGDCSTRSLWNMVQSTVDQLLDQLTLNDLLTPEKVTGKNLKQVLEHTSLH